MCNGRRSDAVCLRADPDLANAFMQKAEDEGGQIDVSNGKNQVYKWLRKAVRCATPVAPRHRVAER